MIKVLFVCLGNICRSPMGEFILKDIVKRNNMEELFIIKSAGTSNEELGNPIYYLAKEKLKEHRISCEGKYAETLNISDYDKYDYILAMERKNVVDIKRIFDGDINNKVYRLLDFTNDPHDIKDPWYTRNFESTYEDLFKGCLAFFEYIKLKLE